MAPRKREGPAKTAPPVNKKPRLETTSAAGETEETTLSKPEGDSSVAETTVPRRRGRPRKTSTAGAPTASTTARAQLAAREKAKKKTSTLPKVATSGADGSAPRKRGRPRKSDVSDPKAKPAGKKKTTRKDEEDEDEEEEDDDDDNDDGHQYWLMKAEPNDRFENGVNVKFSIDDLAAAAVPEPWDGVRNFGARNNMRAMRKGDLAFFYHSNCPVPGIVGLMRVVQEHTPDQSAFDPNHPYYDAKSSPSDPKWDCVHVEFVKKFESPVTLKMLQDSRAQSKDLARMQLLKMGRLSVSGVSPREWRFILAMANEDPRLGEDDSAAKQNEGYEGDTDGEVVPGPKEELNGHTEPTTTTTTTTTTG